MVRSDTNLNFRHRDFADSAEIEWERPDSGASHSGHERNHLFINQQGGQFTDVAGVSGVDHPGDARAFATLDFDRDGWLDLATVNANAPLMQLFRNQIGDAQPQNRNHQMIAIRFVGGARTANPDRTLSSRDGYGAMVTVVLGDKQLKREHRCGEGLAAQNSATMVVGLGEHQAADAISVRWPSGNRQSLPAVRAGSLVTVYELAEQSPNGSGYSIEAYRRATVAEPRAPAAVAKGERTLPTITGADAQASLRVYTTMATWCTSCKKELPQFERIRSVFDRADVATYGVPIDENDTPSMLKSYVAQYKPAYTLLDQAGDDEIAAVKRIINDELGSEGLPATIVTDARGRVLHVDWGVCSVSTLRRLVKRGSF